METLKGEEGLAELARNWFRTDQSACTFENPASDYIITLWFRTRKIDTDESHIMAFVEQATV